jgi:hypothetical protein
MRLFYAEFNEGLFGTESNVNIARRTLNMQHKDGKLFNRPLHAIFRNVIKYTRNNTSAPFQEFWASNRCSSKRLLANKSLMHRCKRFTWLQRRFTSKQIRTNNNEQRRTDELMRFGDAAFGPKETFNAPIRVRVHDLDMTLIWCVAINLLIRHHEVRGMMQLENFGFVHRVNEGEGGRWNGQRQRLDRLPNHRQLILLFLHLLLSHRHLPRHACLK